ncbi:hypothetical protein QL285_022744 [Trifolium repens]|nr:hypothetical protein QL285_022744 [Trifolium repens]
MGTEKKFFYFGEEALYRELLQIITPIRITKEVDSWVYSRWCFHCKSRFLYKRFIPPHSLELHSVGVNSQGLDVLGPIEGSRFLMASVVGQVCQHGKI